EHTMTPLVLEDDRFTIATKHWHRLDDGRIQCDVCPRACKLYEGQRGLCFVRGRIDDQVKLTSYGRSSGFCVDPIEKKPLNHFLPGSAVLSFGTAGCNLACKFCQNWDISKSRDIDAANVDLKAFTEEFYRKVCVGHLSDVLDTLVYLRHDTDVWLEITTLLIPGRNDSDEEIAAECAWIRDNLGVDVPVHFTAFHPDYKMTDTPRTPPATLTRARRIAMAEG